jgi:uncharacterized protein
MSKGSIMGARCGAIILPAALGLALAAAAPALLGAAEPPMELRWDQLVPPGPPKPLKPFFAGRSEDPSNPHGAAAQQVPEGRWMSTPSPPTGAAPLPAPVVQGLDGKRVHIGGYVVPLDFEATRVKEFLLVPFVGACIHVPPPPANQIVYVKAEQGFEVKGTFEPVWVTGTLKVTPAFTGLAEAGYSLTAEKVEPRPQG